jgi:hypothetical protein
MGTITKNYIIIILFEKIIMKKECQYCHHLKHHHHQRHNWREKGRMIRSKEKENFKQTYLLCFIHMTFEVMTQPNEHLSDYRTVGLSDRRTIGLSDYRIVGL